MEIFYGHIDALVIVHRESLYFCTVYTFEVLLLQVYMDIAVILSEAHKGVSCCNINDRDR